MEPNDEISKADREVLARGARLQEIAKSPNGQELKQILLDIAEGAFEDLLATNDTHGIVRARAIVAFTDQFLQEWNRGIDDARSLKVQLDERMKEREMEFREAATESTPVSNEAHRARSF